MDLKNLWPKKDAPPIEKALKFIEKYKSKTIVLKYGGQVMASDQLSKAFAQDAAICNLIGLKNLVIHGGGPQIKKKLEAQRQELKTFLNMSYGPQAWADLIQLEGRIRKQRKEAIYKQQEMRRKVIEIIAAGILILTITTLLVSLVWLGVTY